MTKLTIIKYIHSCLLVETADRVALFDPGIFSFDALPVDALERLDDIFISHVHPDHCGIDLIKQLVSKFPQVRITSNLEVVAKLAEQGIAATDQVLDDVSFFEAPHESIHPPRPTPQEKGMHYLNTLSHPGDSHSFQETKAILALPMTAPWGTNVRAYTLALELRPQHVVPIHDWHWRDEARQQAYDMFEQMLGEQGITFHKMQTGVPITIDV